MPAPFLIPAAITGGSAIVAGLLNYAASRASRKGKHEPRKIFNPEQEQYIQQSGQRGRSLLDNPYQGFEGIEAAHNKNLQQNILPSLGEKFNAFANGGGGSPAYQSLLGQAAAASNNDLSALRTQYGLGQQELGHSLLRTGLTP